MRVQPARDPARDGALPANHDKIMFVLQYYCPIYGLDTGTLATPRLNMNTTFTWLRSVNFVLLESTSEYINGHHSDDLPIQSDICMGI
jgi:hypothetical protein